MVTRVLSSSSLFSWWPSIEVSSFDSSSYPYSLFLLLIFISLSPSHLSISIPWSLLSPPCMLFLLLCLVGLVEVLPLHDHTGVRITFHHLVEVLRNRDLVPAVRRQVVQEGVFVTSRVSTASVLESRPQFCHSPRAGRGSSSAASISAYFFLTCRSSA